MIADMHRYGIRIDRPFLSSLDNRVFTRQLELELTIPDAIGNAYRDFDGKKYNVFNPGSPDMVARLLFKHLNVHQGSPLRLTPTQKREEVNDDVLAAFASKHPVIPMIQEYRVMSKLRGTYTLPIQLLTGTDDRLHTRFSPVTAATGRLSSLEPNLQNIPVRTKLGKEVRRAFIAAPGCLLVSLDLSQIEMVWAAHRSQDPVMLGVFQRREDIHTRTTCNVYGLDYAAMIALTRAVEGKTATPEQTEAYAFFKMFQRLPCKTVGFGVLYGQTPEGLQTSLAGEGVIWSLEDCTDLIENKFFGVYPGLKEMLYRDHLTAAKYAMIWDAFGRVRLVPEARSHHKRIKQEGIRKAGNHPEQASAQGGLKLAMAELFYMCRELNIKSICRPLLQIHDQLIFEVAKDLAYEFAAMAQYVMENAIRLTIPTRSSSDIAETWADL